MAPGKLAVLHRDGSAIANLDKKHTPSTTALNFIFMESFLFDYYDSHVKSTHVFDIMSSSDSDSYYLGLHFFSNKILMLGAGSKI